MTRFDTILQRVKTTLKPQPNVRALDVVREVPHAVARLFNGVFSKQAFEKRGQFFDRFAPKTQEEAAKSGMMRVGTTNIDITGAISPVRTIAKEAVQQIAKPSLLKSAANFIKPVETRIAEQGTAGRALKDVLTKAADVGEVQAGKKVAELTKSSLSKLTKDERFNLLDVMEGKVQPISKKVEEAFQIARKQTDEIAQQAKKIGVKVKEKRTITPDEFKGVYRGGSPTDLTKGKNLGISVSTDKAVADRFAGYKKGGITEKFSLSPNAKILDANNISAKTLRADRNEENILKYARENGYDAVDFTKSLVSKPGLGYLPESEIRVLNPDVLEKPITGLTPFQREQLAKGNKVSATLRKPFQQRANYFPHQIPNAEQLTKGPVRKDVIENLVRRGVRTTPEEAGKFVDDYIQFLNTGKRQDSLIKHLVDTGQAKNDAEAFANLQRFRQRTIKRQGSLEFARQVDLPFYDPNPARVLPEFVTNQSKRLAQIEHFGQDNQTINKLIKQIRDQGGDADTVRRATDRILGIVNDSSPMNKASQLLRTLQGFKLGLAAIPNASQGVLNTLLKGDLPALGAGIKGAFSRAGKDFALKSGATLESTLQESVRESGSASKVLGKFLKGTLFSATEKFNRTLAANGGRSFGVRLVKQLQKNPSNQAAPARVNDFETPTI